MDGSIGAAATGDRRHWRRYPARDCAWIRTFRLYPGRGAELVNLSRGGALVEGRDRFTPGCWLETRIATASELLLGRAQVLRCEVARLSAHRGATYRTAVGFERPLKLEALPPCEEPRGDGYPVPRALATIGCAAGSDYPDAR
ncbi:MAG: hypothetical protein HY654_13640 [Acidobacteria bacterium]|nr:hypothetical protein [Acidobacteriota bacterium]